MEYWENSNGNTKHEDEGGVPNEVTGTTAWAVSQAFGNTDQTKVIEYPLGESSALKLHLYILFNEN